MKIEFDQFLVGPVCQFDSWIISQLKVGECYSGAPWLARPPRPGPGLDFGFQYDRIRNNRSKKFGVEYWALPGSNSPWRPCEWVLLASYFHYVFGDCTTAEIKKNLEHTSKKYGLLLIYLLTKCQCKEILLWLLDKKKCCTRMYRFHCQQQCRKKGPLANYDMVH